MGSEPDRTIRESRQSSPPAAFLQPERMSCRWSACELRACARHGHLTYRPDEPELAERLSTATAVGQARRCLRCSDFSAGPPKATGPADRAPLVLRGKALKQAVVITLLAVERAFRFVLLGLGVWAVLRFRDSQQSIQAIQATVDRDLPLLARMGIQVDQLAPVRDLQGAWWSRPAGSPSSPCCPSGVRGDVVDVAAEGAQLERRRGRAAAADRPPRPLGCTHRHSFRPRVPAGCTTGVPVDPTGPRWVEPQ